MMTGHVLDRNKALYEEMDGMTKKELKQAYIRLKKRLRDDNRCSTMRYQNAKQQIYHFRRRLLKIQREIDYLLKHPYSVGLGTRKDKTGGKQNGS